MAYFYDEKIIRNGQLSVLIVQNNQFSVFTGQNMQFTAWLGERGRNVTCVSVKSLKEVNPIGFTRSANRPYKLLDAAL